MPQSDWPSLPLLRCFTSCVSVGVVKLSQNTARVVVHGSAYHDATAAQQWAFRQSAITTIQCGFDQFIVLSAEADGRHAANWGATPVDALIIRMYHATESDPERCSWGPRGFRSPAPSFLSSRPPAGVA